VSAAEDRTDRRTSVKRSGRAAVLAVIRYCGAAFVARHAVQSRRATVLAYHDPDPATLERHLTWLGSRYSFVPLEDILRALREGDMGSLPRRALAITLDDGWSGNALLAPLFRRHGVRPTIFLCTSIVGTHRHFWWTHVPGHVERERLKALPTAQRLAQLAALGYEPEVEYPDRQALSLDEVTEMASVADFGSHCRTHPILPACDDELARSEIAGSAEDLEKMTGRRAGVLAYPNGDFSQRDVELVREAGYDGAMTIAAGYIDARSDPYRLNRIYIDDAAGVTELAACASGVYGGLMRWIRRGDRRGPA
jgi:peptidoglycan/xylan/chitin deacetylase (PgdA/CDA1 family)